MGALGQLLILLTVYGSTSASILVAAPVGTCLKNKGQAYLGVQSFDCRSMNGQFGGNIATDEWGPCYMDWCAIPSTGAVSTGYVWGFDPDQSNKQRSATRTYAALSMPTGDCDKFSGYYHGNPRAEDWGNCHFYMKRMDGSDRKNVDSTVLAGDGQCANVIGRGAIYMESRFCGVIGGYMHGSPRSRDVVACHLDVCLSPVIKCEPSDMWSEIQTCRNPSTSVLDCSVSMTVGVEKSTSSTSSSGGDISTTITSEVSAELEGLFSASISTSVTTGFNWGSERSTSEVFSTATTRTLGLKLDPGKSVSIVQVVGTCGDYTIDTTEYKVINID